MFYSHHIIALCAKRENVTFHSKRETKTKSHDCLPPQHRQPTKKKIYSAQNSLSVLWCVQARALAGPCETHTYDNLHTNPFEVGERTLTFRVQHMRIYIRRIVIVVVVVVAVCRKRRARSRMCWWLCVCFCARYAHVYISAHTETAQLYPLCHRPEPHANRSSFQRLKPTKQPPTGPAI